MKPVSSADKLLIHGFARFDKIAMGVSIGALLGVLVFIATNILLLKGGEPIGPNLALLSQFFIGYTVTFTGSLVGLLYGFATGFLMGWLLAFVHNSATAAYFFAVKLAARISSVADFTDSDYS